MPRRSTKHVPCQSFSKTKTGRPGRVRSVMKAVRKTCLVLMTDNPAARLFYVQFPSFAPQNPARPDQPGRTPPRVPGRCRIEDRSGGSQVAPVGSAGTRFRRDATKCSATADDLPAVLPAYLILKFPAEPSRCCEWQPAQVPCSFIRLAVLSAPPAIALAASRAVSASAAAAGSLAFQ